MDNKNKAIHIFGIEGMAYTQSQDIAVRYASDLKGKDMEKVEIEESYHDNERVRYEADADIRDFIEQHDVSVDIPFESFKLLVKLIEGVEE